MGNLGDVIANKSKSYRNHANITCSPNPKNANSTCSDYLDDMDLTDLDYLDDVSSSKSSD